MGFFDKIKSGASKAAQSALEKAREHAAENDTQKERAPEDAEAYAKKVADSIDADVRMVSGCMDCQTSADVRDVSKFGLPNADGAGGACTNAMLMSLVDSESDTWLSLLRTMRETLKGKRFSQIPQLSTSHIIDVNGPFSVMNLESNGNTRALLIGINYIGQQGELAGCHNDVCAMVNYISGQGYSTDPDNCLVLMDDGEHQDPTRENITNGFRWLVDGASPGDSLFMHYSGHGAYVNDTSGDEADNKDETLVPLDYTKAGQISDDEILRELVMVLPEGVTLTVLMDCCHSGSIMDLPYALRADDDTLAAVEAGETPAMSVNPDFNLTKIIAVAKELYSMFKTGGLDVSNLGKLAGMAMS